MSIERLNRHQRPIAKRIIVRGTLILDTPTCLGSGDADSPTDLALLRDSISDYALLTGSSIAGALRNYLREYEQGYGKEEQNTDRATFLFGGTRRNDDGEQSTLIVNDAISSKIPTVELRDGVEIEGKTGTAKKDHKYDLELLAVGTEFSLCFELLIEQKQDPREQQNYEDRLVKSLVLALRGLELGEISIGMKKRRGFGRCKVKAWQVWEFDLTQNEKRLEWLLFEHWCTELSTEHETYSSIATAFEVSLDEEEDKRDRLFLEATFQLASPLLIRSGQDSTGCAPDVVHLRSHRDGELKPVLSGTSLAGVLRHRAERIVNTLEKPEKIVDDVFGFVKENSKQAKASRLVVHESVIENTDDLVQNRIAIDRFTGGAYSGALFSEQPIFGSDKTIVTVELELRNPKDYEIGLLLLLLKDLWTSDLPVGGESSIGRGRLQGKDATLTWHKWDQEKKLQQKEKWTIVQVGENKPLEVTDSDRLEEFVQHLVNYPTEVVKVNE